MRPMVGVAGVGNPTMAVAAESSTVERVGGSICDSQLPKITSALIRTASTATMRVINFSSEASELANCRRLRQPK